MHVPMAGAVPMAANTGIFGRGLLHSHGAPQATAGGPDSNTGSLWHHHGHYSLGGGERPGVV